MKQTISQEEPGRRHGDRNRPGAIPFKVVKGWLFLWAALGMTGLLVPSAYSETWEQWLSKSRSWRDVESWLDSKFVYDQGRLSEAPNWTRGMKIQAPQTTFERASGICADVAIFCKHSLNHINAQYRAEIVYLNPGQGELPHYVCSFFVDGKLHIMDYGNYVETTRGTFGPFDSLEDYESLYLKRIGSEALESSGFGWMKIRPAHR
jgi:hypothetical protein